MEAVSAGTAKALKGAPGGAAAEPDGEAEAAFLVFDYEKRDPLTGDALLTKVSLESGAEPAGHDTEEVRKK